MFIDARSQAEFAMIGHPAAVDGNVPVQFLTDRLNPESGAYAMDTNPGFVADVDALMARLGKSKDAPVFVICRSAAAADMLTEAGYARVYSVVDGFEGAVDKATGHRTVDGWRNADLPWTYTLSAPRPTPFMRNLFSGCGML